MKPLLTFEVPEDVDVIRVVWKWPDRPSGEIVMKRGYPPKEGATNDDRLRTALEHIAEQADEGEREFFGGEHAVDAPDDTRIDLGTWGFLTLGDLRAVRDTVKE